MEDSVKKVIVLGCPGSGKSTFSRKLNSITRIPVIYLDMMFHRADKTTCSAEEFNHSLAKVMKQDKWILDGNYGRTIQVRLEQCDTVFWLDYPLEICLQGIEARRGKPRVDMPWIETEPDEEFINYVKNFQQDIRPKMKSLLEQTIEKEIHIFTAREQADLYLNKLQEKELISFTEGI